MLAVGSVIMTKWAREGRDHDDARRRLGDHDEAGGGGP
jgi:hypothetical protein